MTMPEIVSEVNFLLGFPANENIEEAQPEQAVNIAFRELKRYIKTPVDMTVPYSRRLDLMKLGIHTKRVISVFAARPRLGLSLGSIESGNVFEVATAVNTFGYGGTAGRVNINPIMNEMALAQVRNALTTDFQWTWDPHNKVIYCPHRAPVPHSVTIRYVPDYKDVSELTGDTWIDYLIRMSVANMKLAQGRSMSKYVIEGSNVSNDGAARIEEARAELEVIRAELDAKRSKLVVVN